MEIQNNMEECEVCYFNSAIPEGREQMKWNPCHWLQLNAEIWQWIVRSKQEEHQGEKS